jgi:hypothetical protein
MVGQRADPVKATVHGNCLNFAVEREEKAAFDFVRRGGGLIRRPGRQGSALRSAKGRGDASLGEAQKDSSALLAIDDDREHLHRGAEAAATRCVHFVDRWREVRQLF